MALRQPCVDTLVQSFYYPVQFNSSGQALLAKPRQTNNRHQKEQKSVVREAWDNMMQDFDRFSPKGLRGTQGKKKFVLWLFVLEVIVLGALGKFVYDWITS